MKTFTKICSSITLVFTLSIGVMAQVPQGFNFQAAATAPDGTPLSSVEIGVQIDVVKGTEEGDVVYTETHNVTTNAVGLFQIIIGEGSPAESNDFTTINWGNDNYFVGFGVDLTGTGTYESLGKTRLLSVPYALLAQDVVNGSGTGTVITSLEFDTSQPDSAFFVDVEGPRSGSAIIASASTDSTNVGGEFYANSAIGNPNLQIGTYGEATGDGSGTHTGTYGYAKSAEGSMRGAYGGIDVSDNPNSFFDIGVSGQAFGELVSPETFSIGVYGQNTVRGGSEAWGTGGYAGGDGMNLAFRGRANSVDGNPMEQFGAWLQANGLGTGRHYGVWTRAAGLGENYGIYATADGGTSNYAGWFDGEVVVTGDLTVNGTINGESGGATTEYFLDATADTAFQVTISGDEGPVNNSAIIGLANTAGTNVGVEGKAHSSTGNERFQIGSYGEALGDGTGSHYAFYGYATGNGKFTQGTRNLVSGPGNGEIVPIGDPEEQNGNFGSFNIGYSTYVQGNSNGNTGLDIEIGGDQGSRINIGAEARVFTTSSAHNSGFQAIVNGSSTLNRGYWGYINGDNENIGMDLTVEGGIDNRGIIVNADIAATFNGAVEVNQNAIDVVGDTDDDQLVKIQGSGINAGINPYSNGIVMNHNTEGGSVFEMYKNDIQTVLITGDGNASFAGTVSQASDSRLKRNISELPNTLNNILALRGVSYNWIDENKTQDLQIGVIAQEVEEIYPEFVHTDEEGMKSVNYSQMVTVLIEAVKELNSKIEVLEAENSELQAQINDIETMKAQISKLMTLISVETAQDSFSADK